MFHCWICTKDRSPKGSEAAIQYGPKLLQIWMKNGPKYEKFKRNRNKYKNGF